MIFFLWLHGLIQLKLKKYRVSMELLHEVLHQPKACALFRLIRKGRGFSCTGVFVSLGGWTSPTSDPEYTRVQVPFSRVQQELQALGTGLCLPFLSDITCPGEVYQCAYFSAQPKELEQLSLRLQQKSVNVCGCWVTRCSYASQLQRTDYRAMDYDDFWNRG